ncbi:peptidase C39 family protein [Streptomyces sp. NPDC051940]|uniref:peptidase C39 family protein n=1 Tax=Streptomyces sp. NPDC051940 TaxID=3155675 RepID=UPI00342DB3E7
MTAAPSRRTVLTAALVATAGTAIATALGQPSATAATAPVDYHAWCTAADWGGGTANGTAVADGGRPGIVIGTPAGTVSYRDPHTKKSASWEYATWTGPTHGLGTPATEAVASWNADTPAGTWIQIELKGTYSDGTATPWYVMGRWASGDADIKRTSVGSQSDKKSSILTDTFAILSPATGLRLVSYQLRMTLYRKPGTSATPKVWRVGAMASDIPDRFTVPASTPGAAAGTELAVPRYSQEIHAGQYPEYDGGGEAWCSPTSSQMIIEYWGRTPTAADLAWVNPSYADPQVDHAARYVYDYQYDGCGNWPFNAAYAATYPAMHGVVTRLGSLTDAETLIAAGIPVITSQSFLSSELDGAGYGTSGHLMTVIGFTPDGDVVANDPASPSDAAVRRVYDRAQFETIWLRTKRRLANGSTASGSGGIVYLYWPSEATAAQLAALAAVGVA